MHGHSYRVEAKLQGSVDPVTGFVIDFFDIETKFAPLITQLDHCCLNEIEGLENPTAENIAIWIWELSNLVFRSFLLSGFMKRTSDSWVEYDGC